MVSTSWLLLTQSLSISMVGAERMKISGEFATSLKKDTAAEKMQFVFKDKENAICGGPEIRNVLTQGKNVGSWRASNWDKVIKIADSYLENVEIEIPTLTKAIKELETRLKLAGASEAFKDVTAADIVPVILKAIEKEEVFIDVHQAVDSKCGLKQDENVRKENRRRKREARKTGTEPDFLTVMALDAFGNAVKSWGAELKVFLSGGKVRANSDVVRSACCNQFDCADTAPGASYCDEFCTQISQDQQLNEVAFLGGETKTLQEELDKKSSALAYLVSEQKECEGARAALLDFQQQMDVLNLDIEAAFKKYREANSDVGAAEKGLDSMAEQQNDLSAKLEELENTLAEKNKIEEGLKGQMAEIKAQEPVMRSAVSAAIGAYEAASTRLDDAMGALTSFNKLKGLVGVTVVNMWMYFSTGVLEHMNTLGIEKGYTLTEYFTEAYKNHENYIPLLKGMKWLSEHCENAALPAFKGVEDADLQKDLNDMCVYDPFAEATAEFGDEVMEIKKKMLSSLEKAQKWHEPTDGHPEYTQEFLKQVVVDGEIAMLRDIENSFGTSDYYTQYLTNWKRGGLFLGLLEKLKAVEADLAKLKADLDTKVATGKAMLAELMKKKKNTFTALQKALQESEDADADVTQAKEEEAALQALIDVAEANLESLYDLLDKADAAYAAAKAAFATAHKKGTNLDF